MPAFRFSAIISQQAVSLRPGVALITFASPNPRWPTPINPILIVSATEKNEVGEMFAMAIPDKPNIPVVRNCLLEKFFFILSVNKWTTMLSAFNIRNYVYVTEDT